MTLSAHRTCRGSRMPAPWMCWRTWRWPGCMCRPVTLAGWGWQSRPSKRWARSARRWRGRWPLASVHPIDRRLRRDFKAHGRDRSGRRPASATVHRSSPVAVYRCHLPRDCGLSRCFVGVRTESGRSSIGHRHGLGRCAVLSGGGTIPGAVAICGRACHRGGSLLGRHRHPVCVDHRRRFVVDASAVSAHLSAVRGSAVGGLWCLRQQRDNQRRAGTWNSTLLAAQWNAGAPPSLSMAVEPSSSPARQVDLLCPRCQGVLHTMRKPYESAGKSG